MAPRDIPAGANYAGSIVRAINAARAMVLVFSANSNASSAVWNEVERAFAKRIPLIPTRIENVVPSEELEFFLSTPQWIDAQDKDTDHSADVLARTVRGILSSASHRTERQSQGENASVNGSAKPDAAFGKVKLGRTTVRWVAGLRPATKIWALGIAGFALLVLVTGTIVLRNSGVAPNPNINPAKPSSAHVPTADDFLAPLPPKSINRLVKTAIDPVVDVVLRALADSKAAKELDAKAQPIIKAARAAAALAARNADGYGAAVIQGGYGDWT